MANTDMLADRGERSLAGQTRSLFAQLHLLIGMRGMRVAIAAAVLGAICCATALIGISQSLSRPPIDPERVRAHQIHSLDQSSRVLMRSLFVDLANRSPGRVRTAWNRFVDTLEIVCRDAEVAEGTYLGIACRDQPQLIRRIGPAIERFDAGLAPVPGPIIKEIVNLRDDVGDLADTSSAAVEGLIDRLVERYTGAILVLIFCSVGFAGSGLLLAFLVARTSVAYHEQWRAAETLGEQARAGRDQLQEIIEALPAGVVVYDSGERLMAFNSAATIASPASLRPESIGQTYEQLAHTSAQHLEAAGMGPQPVEEWIRRFRSHGQQRARRRTNGRWFDWSERVTPSGLIIGLRTDVTELTEHEIALEAARLEADRARTRYQALVESLADMVYATNEKGYFTYVSPGAVELLGAPVEAIVGTRFRDWVHPDDCTLVMDAYHEFRRLPTAQQRMLRFRMRALDGTIRPVEVRFREPTDKSPQVAQVGVIRDVTELESARAEYESLVGSLADVAYRLDVESGRFTFVSASARDVLGRPPEDMVGKHFLDLTAPESREHVTSVTTRPYSQSDVQSSMRFKMIDPDGASRTVEIRARRHLDAQGRRISTGIIRDIEDQVKLEARLEAHVARLTSIVESAGALVILVDRDLRIEMVNHEFTTLTGLEADQAIGQLLTQAIDCPAELNGRDRSRFALKIRDRQGVDRLLVVTATPVETDGREVSHIILLGVDDTERRAAERALSDVERFATVGEMAATMAHEVSQPLQVISLACASALDELDLAGEATSIDAAYIRSKLDRIAQQIAQASRIMNDLRSFVRGTEFTEAQLFQANDSVRAALDLTAYGLQLAGIDVSQRLGETVPPVMGYAPKLEQILVNLINNARDAGGRNVVIETELVARENRPHVRISVLDTGPGISADVLPRLFNSFVSTKARGKGTGLGLRICRRLIEEMGGALQAANRPEGGAQFDVFLPAANALPHPEQPGIAA